MYRLQTEFGNIIRVHIFYISPDFKSEGSWKCMVWLRVDSISLYIVTQCNIDNVYTLWALFSIFLNKDLYFHYIFSIVYAHCTMYNKCFLVPLFYKVLCFTLEILWKPSSYHCSCISWFLSTFFLLFIQAVVLMAVTKYTVWLTIIYFAEVEHFYRSLPPPITTNATFRFWLVFVIIKILYITWL